MTLHSAQSKLPGSSLISVLHWETGLQGRYLAEAGRVPGWSQPRGLLSFLGLTQMPRGRWTDASETWAPIQAPPLLGRESMAGSLPGCIVSIGLVGPGPCQPRTQGWVCSRRRTKVCVRSSLPIRAWLGLSQASSRGLKRWPGSEASGLQRVGDNPETTRSVLGAGACHVLFSASASCLSFWPPHAAHGILVSPPGIGPAPLAVRAPSPNRWSTGVI